MYLTSKKDQHCSVCRKPISQTKQKAQLSLG